MCLIRRTVWRVAIITRRGRYAIRYLSYLFRRVFQARVRVINQLIRGRRVREFRRRFGRDRATTLTAQRRHRLFVKDLTTRRRHAGCIPCLHTCVARHRVISDLGCNRFLVGRQYLVLDRVTCLRTISRPRLATVLCLIRSAFRGDKFTLTVLARGDGLVTAIGLYHRVLRRRVITVHLNRPVGVGHRGAQVQY